MLRLRYSLKMRGAANSVGKFHWADFVKLADGDRRELVDGRLWEIDVPTKLHERIVMLLGMYLQVWALNRGGYVVLGSGFKVRINEKRGVMPDVQMLTEKVYENSPDAGLDSGHPELVVEVISSSSRGHDRVTKLNWYARIGVPEYWLVDADARTLERLRLDGKTYRIVQTARDNETLKPTSFKGLEIPLAKLWKKKPRPSKATR